MDILLIAYDFPPGANVGGKRPASFCRYLPDYGIHPIVLTVAPHFYKACDVTVTPPPGIRVERTSMLPDPLEWYRALMRSLHSCDKVDAVTKQSEPNLQSKSNPTQSLRQNILSLLGLYEAYWRWYPQATRTGARLIKQESVAAVISTFPPSVSHLVGRFLKRKHGLPWLADFRDAWASSGWGMKNPLGWANILTRNLEASFLREADLIICNTDGMRRDFIQTYPDVQSAKLVTLTNGYDDVDLPLGLARGNSTTPLEFAKRDRHKRVLLHLGELYLGRRVDTLCQAVNRLIESKKLDPKSIRVVFQGDATPAIISAAEKAVPKLIQSGLIEFRPRVDWKAGQQLLETADLLLIIQGDHPAIPAKFFEYLRTGKPIFAVVQEGPLTDILKATGAGLWADPHDPASIAAKLVEAMARPRRPPEEVREVANRFHYRSLTARLAEWISELTSAGIGSRERS